MSIRFPFLPVSAHSILCVLFRICLALVCFALFLAASFLCSFCLSYVCIRVMRGFLLDSGTSFWTYCHSDQSEADRGMATFDNLSECFYQLRSRMFGATISYIYIYIDMDFARHYNCAPFQAGNLVWFALVVLLKSHFAHLCRDSGAAMDGLFDVSNRKALVSQ